MDQQIVQTYQSRFSCGCQSVCQEVCSTNFWILASSQVTEAPGRSYHSEKPVATRTMYVGCLLLKNYLDLLYIIQLGNITLFSSLEYIAQKENYLQCYLLIFHYWFVWTNFIEVKLWSTDLVFFWAITHSTPWCVYECHDILSSKIIKQANMITKTMTTTMKWTPNKSLL